MPPIIQFTESNYNDDDASLFDPSLVLDDVHRILGAVLPLACGQIIVPHQSLPSDARRCDIAMTTQLPAAVAERILCSREGYTALYVPDDTLPVIPRSVLIRVLLYDAHAPRHGIPVKFAHLALCGVGVHSSLAKILAGCPEYCGHIQQTTYPGSEYELMHGTVLSSSELATFLRALDANTVYSLCDVRGKCMQYMVPARVYRLITRSCELAGIWYKCD